MLDIPSQHIVVMGVSASGKTTIASALAEKLSWTFFDADDFHPRENIQKLLQGVALDDVDREPWLNSLQEHLINMSQRGVSSILACSALKKSYREKLALPFSEKNNANISFIFLDVPFDIAKKRMKKRKKEQEHFMSPKLLQSQFDTLEIPKNIEIIGNYPMHCYTIDATSTPENIVKSCVEAISS